MKHILIKSHQFQTSIWSGGTTKQLYIFPPEASYQERNFQFRLSTATVETEQSKFTSLPGVSRKLMILEGKIRITHEDHYSKELGKFEIDSFVGDWRTSAIGTCIDFNLMTTGNTSGELTPHLLSTGELINHSMKNNIRWAFLYVVSGSVNCITNSME